MKTYGGSPPFEPVLSMGCDWSYNTVALALYKLGRSSRGRAVLWVHPSREVEASKVAAAFGIGIRANVDLIDIDTWYVEDGDRRVGSEGP